MEEGVRYSTHAGRQSKLIIAFMAIGVLIFQL
jgi:hypothetical protein